MEVTNAPLLEGHTFPDKEIVLMRIIEEANLYSVRIKIIRSDGFQVDARGVNGDPFYVVAYYGTTAFKWKVTKCITWNGRLAYVPVEKGQKKSAGKAWVRIVPYPLLMFRTYLLHHPTKQLGMPLRIH